MGVSAAPAAADIQWDDAPAPASSVPPAAQPAASQPAPAPSQSAPAPAPISAAPAANGIAWDAQPAAQPAQQPDIPGFTDDEKQQILAYVPKARDAADLEQYSEQLTNGRAKIGNPQAVIDARDKGAQQFGWEKPTVDPSMGQPHPESGIRDTIGNAILDSLDTLMPGLGAALRTHRDSVRAYIANTADAAAGDYGAEVGGFLDTLDPSQWGDFGANLDRNVAHEHAMLTGESNGHPFASAAGQLTGAGLVAPLGSEALDAAGIAADGSTVEGAIRTAGGGAVYGSGAAGPGNRAEGAAMGAGLGAATDLALPYLPTVIKAIKPAAKVLDPEAQAAASAAADLGITLPKFALSDADRAKAGALEQTPFGRGQITGGRQAMLDTSAAARDAIARDVGTVPDTSAQLGEQTLDAAIASNKNRRAAIGDLYDYANTMAAGSKIAPTATLSALNSLLSDESAKIGGSKIAPILQSFRDDLSDAGTITVDQARDLRTSLREQLTNEAGATPTNADRITNQVMSAVNADMQNGLPGDATAAYKQADAAWAQQRDLEDSVLKPFLGHNFDNEGEQVVAKINSAAKGYGTRLARFLSSLPDDDANNVRASIIIGLGKSSAGTQNAAGDAFSLSTFLTNWNQLSGARKLIFAPDTVNALDKLAQVAQVAKRAEASRNFSNTGGVISRLLLGTEGTASGVGLVTGHPTEAVMAALAGAFQALRQFSAAKMLASPSLAKKIAATPMNVKAAQAFWSRPWVKGLQLQNPAIAGEIQAFQQTFLKGVNDNIGKLPNAATGPNSEQDNQNQQP